MEAGISPLLSFNFCVKSCHCVRAVSIALHTFHSIIDLKLLRAIYLNLGLFFQNAIFLWEYHRILNLLRLISSQRISMEGKLLPSMLTRTCCDAHSGHDGLSLTHTRDRSHTCTVFSIWLGFDNQSLRLGFYIYGFVCSTWTEG